MDHETWTFDLEEANASGSPRWYKLYSMKEEYGMTDLSPDSHAKLVESLKADEVLFKKYHRYHHYTLLASHH